MSHPPMSLEAWKAHHADHGHIVEVVNITGDYRTTQLDCPCSAKRILSVHSTKPFRPEPQPRSGRTGTWHLR